MPTPTLPAPTRGQRLRDARKRNGLTQTQLAALCDVNRMTIMRVENGETTPSVTLALAIARELGEPVEALFGGER